MAMENPLNLNPVGAEKDDTLSLPILSVELETLKEEIFKRDEKIKELEDNFSHEKGKTERLGELLQLEESHNSESEFMISNLKQKLDESEALMKEMRDGLGSRTAVAGESEESSIKGSGNLSTKTFERGKEDENVWKYRCQDLESQLEIERNRLETERSEHAKVIDKLAQSEELLKNFKEDIFYASDDWDENGDESKAKYKKAIGALKASVDVQSRRNIELHEELQLSRKESEGREKLVEELQSKGENDQKLIEELNTHNEREYKKSEKLKGDIQRLKKDLESWKRIQADMKVQYQDLRVLYDGICKHADEQKREILEMKLLMDRDKRSIGRQRDEIDKLKCRVASLRQTYDDLKVTHDENAKHLEEKKNESTALASQLQNNKKVVSDLQNSNKDLKKRSDFSQNELVEKHRLLLQAEEKLKSFQDVFDAKDTEVEESRKVTKEAVEKAEKHSNEVAIREKDLHDRIALIQSLQAQVEELDNIVKMKDEDGKIIKELLEEKDKIVEENDQGMRRKDEYAKEKERRVLEFMELVKDLEQLLESTKKEIEKKEDSINEREASIESFVQQIVLKDTQLLDEKRTNVELKEALKKKNNILNELERQADIEDKEKNELRARLEEIRRIGDEKDEEIRLIRSEMEEDKKKVYLQNQLLKELERKFEDEDLRNMIEFEDVLKKKDYELADMKLALSEREVFIANIKKEFSGGDTVQVYLKEIEELNDILSEEKSVSAGLRQEITELHLHRSDDILKMEEEKKETMLQLTKELKRERQTNQSVVNDLKDDIRVLEGSLANERDLFKVMVKELELKDRQLKNDRESLLEHIEELQTLIAKERESGDLDREKIDDLEREIRENERTRVKELEEVEAKHLSAESEKKSSLILDRQEKIEELRKELGIKKEQLYEAASRIEEVSKAREDERREVERLLDERNDYVTSLKRENSELRKSWKEESQWMEENAVESEAPVLENNSSSAHFQTKEDQVKEEQRILATQKIVIQNIKKDIEAKYNLNKFLLQNMRGSDDLITKTTQHDEERRYQPGEKGDSIRMALEKIIIVLLLTPLAYFYSCKVCLTFAAVLAPMLYFIYTKPWKNVSEQDNELFDSLDQLTTRLAAECSETEHLRRTIDNIKQQEPMNDSSQNNNDHYRLRLKESHGALESEGLFAQEMEKVMSDPGKHCREEYVQQREEIELIKQTQQDDRKRLQRQQSLIEKLEIVFHEKEIKHGLGQFWGYEELKMAINRLKHEREMKKNKEEGTNNENMQKRLAEVIDEAVEREKRRKFKAVVLTIFFSAALVFGFSLRSSTLYTAASAVTIVVCSIIYGIRMWKEIEGMKSRLQVETRTVEAQEAEIKELSTLLDREHDVVSKQKLAIEALEQRLNDEYKNNKDQQLTIARLMWVFQESNEMLDVIQRLKDSQNEIDLNPELRKLAEDHARNKFVVFRSMQLQLEEHRSRNEEQLKVIDDLKNATDVIVNTAGTQLSEMKNQRASRICDSKYFTRNLGWKASLLAGACVTTFFACLSFENYIAVTLPVVCFLAFVVIKKARSLKGGESPTKIPGMLSQKPKPSVSKSFSSAKLYCYDFLYMAALGGISYYSSGFSFVLAALALVAVLIIRLATYFLYRRKLNEYVDSWSYVVEDLRIQIHERTQLIDVQTEEIETLKKLLEVERSYSQHAERILKDINGGDDDNFEEISKMGFLKQRIMEIDGDDTQRDDLVKYELDELKIFLEEEKKTNVNLRKCVAEAEEEKNVLTNEVVTLKRKLESEQLRGRQVERSREEEELLKDRIEELLEDLDGERRTKQELSAKLIEERSLRELKQIELGDLKEKIRDEVKVKQILREQVLATSSQEDTSLLREELTFAQNELEEERGDSQRHNHSFIDAMHKLREHNLVLQRKIEELRGDVKDVNEGIGLCELREQCEVQQDEIESLQMLLEDITSTKKALKYQDVIEELNTLRRKLEYHDSRYLGNDQDLKLRDVVLELEHEKEKNKILEEAIDELQRQAREQRKMYEDERKRSIELARQISGEDIPMMVEEDGKDDLEDTRGVLYWLGTNGGLTEWKNPAERGLVLVSRSSYGHGKATDVADRKPSWCSTSNKPNQWWKIDFGDKRTVVPTAYSLRHGWSGNAGALRHWVFEGSLDGRRWVMLRQHENDDTLKTAYGFGYWKIENVETGFRFVRVRQTGSNSTGTNAMRLCGIEVYGKLVIAEG